MFEKYFLKLLLVLFIIAVPTGSFIYVKNMTLSEGKKIRRIEREITNLKKINSNLENELSEKIDFKKIERLARQKYGLGFINEHKNSIIMVKE